MLLIIVTVTAQHFNLLLLWSV